ncbi:DUF1592 domain-containing protein [Henriciella litoralis]|uniref:DUF1592 domain-containing protein n=1 Tax=Henriciella litoralis TaxID=568102 RepID=UPI000A05C8A0|nr:DUF1592 domain-containing protein [Henriciella litoralis]
MSVARIGLFAAGAVLLGAGAYFAAPHSLGGGTSAGADYQAPPPQMRRITEAQYRNSIADVFSPEISVVGRFEPDVRIEGLAAVGSTSASISSSGYEHYYAIAGRVADQVVSDAHWDEFMPCDASAREVYDEACARQIVDLYGEQLLRRDLSEGDVNDWVAVTDAAHKKLGDFHEAVGLAVEGMLSSPEYLFIIDSVQGEGGKTLELTDYSKAARLSYFLWNTTPDEELLRAASAGELDTKKGLTAQVDRMIASERVDHGVNAFFEDFMHLDGIDTLEKDNLIYRAFNRAVAEDARDQVLKFIDYHLIERDAPYTDIFTAKETFVTRPLGMIYQVPVASVDGWEKIKFEDDDPRGGLLSHIGFSALHSHPGRSSATLRGIAVREQLLCQSVAPAPAAVNFTVVQEVDNPEFKTARARLTQHRTDDACKSCHEFIDPIGLAMENFDGVGRLRMTENGEVIDVGGSIDGTDFVGVDGLGEVLSEHPATTSCLVEKMQKFATGRPSRREDVAWLNRLNTKFEKADFRIKPLLREIALSPEFFAVAPAQVDVSVDQEQAQANPQLEKKS